MMATVAGWGKGRRGAGLIAMVIALVASIRTVDAITLPCRERIWNHLARLKMAVDACVRSGDVG